MYVEENWVFDSKNKSEVISLGENLWRVTRMERITNEENRRRGDKKLKNVSQKTNVSNMDVFQKSRH